MSARGIRISYLCCIVDEEAVAHIMQVACGLDSMIVGEPQILGQMKDAFSESCSANAVSDVVSSTYFSIFLPSLKKFGQRLRLVHVLFLLHLRLCILPNSKFRNLAIRQANVALIGAGDTTRVIAALSDKSSVATPMTSVNRNIEKAAALAETIWW